MDVKQQDNHISNLLPSGFLSHDNGGTEGGKKTIETGGGYKIALFGGTFDPIHIAHIALADACRVQLGVDEVWFLVTPQNPWKQGNRLSADHDRLRMVQLAVEGHQGLVASDYEFHLEKPTYSYLTLRHLREDYPEHEFILLIGGDNWAQFDHWSHYEEILRNHAIAVYPREGSPIDTPQAIASPPHSLHIIQAPQLPISSTSIRQLVAEDSGIAALVPPAVAQYILDNHLYK